MTPEEWSTIRRSISVAEIAYERQAEYIETLKAAIKQLRDGVRILAYDYEADPVDCLTKIKQFVDSGLFDSTQVHERNHMDFGDAIRALKAGKKVARSGWNGKGMFIVLMPALYLPPYHTQGTDRKVNDRTAKWIGEDKPLDSQPYLAMYTARGQWQPGWLASQADMLGDDWMVVE